MDTGGGEAFLGEVRCKEISTTFCLYKHQDPVTTCNMTDKMIYMLNDKTRQTRLNKIPICMLIEIIEIKTHDTK